MRKIYICFAVAAVSVLLTLCNITGYASSTDTTYDESLSALNAMGVLNLPDSERDNQNITRAQFAANILNIAGYEKVNHSAENIPFSDVSVDYVYKDEICTLYDMKIINGTENGFFSPEEPITYVQAVKLAADILGYREYVSVKYGKYPNGYISAAYDLKLTDGIKSPVTDIPLNLKDAVRFLYNTACSFVSEGEEYKTNGGITYAKDSRMLITKGHNIYYGEGVLKSNGVCALTGVTLKKGHTEINNEEYMIGKCDVLSLLGSKVKYFYREEKGGNVLLWASEHKSNKTLTINSRDLITDDTDYSAEKIIYYDKNKRTAAEISPFASIVYNNKLRNITCVIKPVSGTVKLTDSDGDGRWETVTVNEFKNIFITGILPNEKVIADKFGNTVCLNDYKNVTIVKEGRKINIEEVPTRVIASYTEDEEKESIYVYICDEGELGTLETVGEENGKNIYTFSGKEKRISYSYSKIISDGIYPACELKIGENYKYYTDISGDIAELENRNDGKIRYAYLIDAAKDNKATAKSYAALVKFLLDNGDIIIAKAEKNIKINNVSGFTGEDLLNCPFISEGGKIKQQVVKIALGHDDKVLEIQFAEDNTNSEYGYNSNVFSLDFSCNQIGEPSYYYGSKIDAFAVDGNAKYFVTDGTICFVKYSDSLQDEPYAVTSALNFADKGRYNVELYDCNEKMEIAAMSTVRTRGGVENAIFVVDNVRYVLGENGENLKQVSGYKNGNYLTYTELYEDIIPDGMQRGDAIKIGMYNGKISSFKQICSLRQYPEAFIEADSVREDGLLFGQLYSVGINNIVTVVPDSEKAVYGKLVSSSLAEIWANPVYITIYNCADDTISKGELRDILPASGPDNNGDLPADGRKIMALLNKTKGYARDIVVVYY